MSKGPLILWLLIELGRLSLIPAAPETVRGFLGQSVTLPCKYSSWSENSNSMCWGKGPCPKSKCNNELLHTDGMTVLSRKSSKYELQGNIRQGNVSLTILNTNEGDNSVYCCRIEVPGWFNDVKKNIRLQLRRAPTTKRPTTTTAMTTTIAVLPTTAVTTPELTTRTPLQTTLTAVATTCPPTISTFLPEATLVLETTEPSMGAPTFTTESESFFLSSDSERSTEVTSGNIALLTSRESEGWGLQSTSQTSMWEMSESVTFLQPRESETAMVVQNEAQSEEVKMVINPDLLMIIAPSVGFVLLVLLVAFFLRGKVMKTNCFQKHTRLDNVGECKNTSEDMQHGGEVEDGLFTL
ncbi:T-cell immunoglobulin and mucin domain-containing protein 4 isoform X1 [Panthera pardus]|uniref:T cell immunoglobulin and mucin domain containing 4 n=2 Tax=Panthera TaxID=9688 RepID=A0A8C9KE96_PANTA|nr:T-cell immunoglobulin and mucin domain-containing protein 4 isoform X1 [Panthera tigris]XP_019320060.1 T-cell immunoglobulin and mucin domain-containing protein 4 isoform X1 [Panthera pardus]XP_042804375.1 T-cell immunoglobulin and mucin domain-containing protein 4 isoform X1 [Panthera leo]